MPWQTAPASPVRRVARRLAWLARATLIVVLAGPPAFAAATTLYVDQNHAQCTDAGAGTPQAPWCTIGAAAAHIAPGDTVVVRPGTYPEQVVIDAAGTASDPIVFTADSGVTVTGQPHGFDLSGSSWLTLQGFTLAATTNDAIRAWLVTHLTIANNQVLDAGGTGIEVRDCGDVTIANNVVEGSTGPGILVKFCSQVTLTDNHVSGAGQPIQGKNQPGIVLNSSTDCVVADNLTEANSDAGIYVSNGSTGLHLFHNTSRYNARGFARAAAGIDLRDSSGNTIEANRSHDNEDSGINVRNGAPNNLVINNVSYHNGDHGIDFLRAPNGRLIGNTVYGNVKHGFEIEGESVGMTVTNNICVDNGHANIRTSANAAPSSSADYNLVYRSTPGALYEWAGVGYATLGALRAAHPHLEGHGIEADPLWVAPEAGDLQLRADSPAIDSANAGVSGALGYDVDGTARVDDAGTPNTGVGPRTYDDRGAFEYQGMDPPNPNTPPQIVSGPTAMPNQLFSDETAELDVTAIDADGNPLTYQWIVPPGGGSISGTGPIVTYLPPALTTVLQVYTITVEVTDGFGGLAEGSVDITVEPQPPGNILSFRPVADTWVSETEPNQNQGNSKRLYVDKSAIKTTFLRFEVTGLAAPIQSAWIELEVIRTSSHGGTIHAISDHSWGEFTVTYNNRPVIDGPALTTVGAVSAGDIIQLDVTQAIGQNGQYSFAIVGNGKKGWAVRSREGSANTPILFITLNPTP